MRERTRLFHVRAAEIAGLTPGNFQWDDQFWDEFGQIYRMVQAAGGIINIGAPMFSKNVAADITHVQNDTNWENITGLAVGAGVDTLVGGFFSIVYTTSAVANIKFRVTAPAGGSIKGRGIIYRTLAGADAVKADEVDLTAAFSCGGGAGTYTFSGFFAAENPTTAGQFAVQYAQDTAEATDTKILKHSWGRYTGEKIPT